MPSVPLRVQRTNDELEAGFDAIRADLQVAELFPPEVLAEAAASIQRGPVPAATEDLRHLPFFTIDPPGAMDLDQAVHIETRGAGHVVHYAIADVAALVPAGGAIDTEARKRGVTIYLPDHNTPLHPPALSENGASLLPDRERQALVWSITLDGDGAQTDVVVRRATVRSRRRLTYEEAQAALGTDEQLDGLRAVGLRREEAEVARGGVSLPLPDQQIVDDDGRYRLEYRAPVPMEGWNAQISLLTGMAAAGLMLEGRVGILRTLPPPSDETLDTLRSRALALGRTWPDGPGGYQRFVRDLDPNVPVEAALLTQAVRLFRGAGYVAFNGTVPVGDAQLHAAVAAPYAHVTAPLRRLVDRFANEIVLALVSGSPVPDWVLAALDGLPAVMAAARRVEGAADSRAVDLVESAVLRACGTRPLDAVVTAVTKGMAVVQLVDPAVVASAPAVDGVSAGQRVTVKAVDDGKPRGPGVAHDRHQSYHRLVSRRAKDRNGRQSMPHRSRTSAAWAPGKKKSASTRCTSAIRLA